MNKQIFLVFIVSILSLASCNECEYIECEQPRESVALNQIELDIYVPWNNQRFENNSSRNPYFKVFEDVASIKETFEQPDINIGADFGVQLNRLEIEGFFEENSLICWVFRDDVTAECEAILSGNEDNHIDFIVRIPGITWEESQIFSVFIQLPLELIVSGVSLEYTMWRSN